MRNLKPIKDEEKGRWEIQGLEPSDATFTKMCEMLREKKAFKFARYGDGEFNCMFGKQGLNCDGHVYFDDLGLQLRKALLSEPDYIVGIQPLSLSYNRSDEVIEMCEKLKIKWVNSDAIHNASIDGKFAEFLEAITGRYIILVGPAHLSNFFDCVHIVIPSLNCWRSYKDVRQQIEFHVDGVNNAVVLFAASMMTEVLIDDFAEYPHTFVDIGSVLDPYCGVISRRYHGKLKI
jgi:hypothetical protein